MLIVLINAISVRLERARRCLLARYLRLRLDAACFDATCIEAEQLVHKQRLAMAQAYIAELAKQIQALEAKR